MNDFFGKKQKSLALYSRLISKTSFVHEKSIRKHIQVFREFYLQNTDAINSRTLDKMTNKVIKFNDKIYINLEHIFKFADTDAKVAIWNHLLALGSLLDPTGKAKEILKNKLGGGKEEQFVSKIIDNVEQNFQPGANPQEIVTNLLSGGFLQEMIGGMNEGLENGDLDMSKLMGAVQTMITAMGEQSGNKDDMAQIQNMVSGMMGNMGPMLDMMKHQKSSEQTEKQE
jgi:hypothetical protein